MVIKYLYVKAHISHRTKYVLDACSVPSLYLFEHYLSILNNTLCRACSLIAMFGDNNTSSNNDDNNNNKNVVGEV